MVEHKATRTTTFAGGFDFARRLRDPELRVALRAIGWKSGEHVVIAADDETVVDVVARIAFHETDGRALIAVTSDAEPRSFRMMMAEVAKGAAQGPVIELGHGASIGMLHASLHPCGTYMPSEWMQRLAFERLP